MKTKDYYNVLVSVMYTVRDIKQQSMNERNFKDVIT